MLCCIVLEVHTHKFHSAMLLTVALIENEGSILLEKYSSTSKHGLLFRVSDFLSCPSY
jgi:hypothetical protein